MCTSIRAQEAPLLLQRPTLPVSGPKQVSEKGSLSHDRLVCGQAGFGWLPSKRNALRPCPSLAQWKPMVTSKEGFAPREAAHTASAGTASLPCADPPCSGVPLQGSPAPVSGIAPSSLRFARRPASFAQIFSELPLVPIVSFLSRTANNKWSFSPRR